MPHPPSHLWKRGSSLEDFEADMSALLRPCRVRGAQRRGYRTEILHQRMGGLGLTAVRLGAPATVRVEPDRAIALLQIPVGGGFSARGVRGRDESFRAGQEAQIADAPTGLDLGFAGDSRMLIVDLGGAELRDMTPARLPPGSLSLATPAGAQLWRLSHFLLSELEAGALTGEGPAALGLEQALLGAIASALGAAEGEAPATRLQGTPRDERLLMRASDFMACHLDQPLRPEAIALAIGISARSLHRLMRDCRGTTPLAALKEMRLQRVRSEIEAGHCPQNGVTSLAHSCGFNHMGAFAADFRQRFGLSPSELLRNQNRG